MNIFILTLVLCAVSVNSSTLTFKDYLKYLSRDESRASHHVQRKPVIGSAMIKQYFNDELVDPAFQPQRPDHYDLANDPDPIIENLPPNHNNLGFLANLNEGQLHDLIAEGLKYQETVNEMIEENEGVVELGTDDSVESSESSDIDSDEETDDLHVIIDEEYEGEHDIENFAETGSKGDEEDEHDDEKLTTTTTQKPSTEKTSTTEEPTTTTQKTKTTVDPITTVESISSSTTMKTSTTSAATTTSLEPTRTTEKATTTTETSTTVQIPTTRAPNTTTTSQPTTTSNPLVNRIIPVNSSGDISSLTPDQIDEDIAPQNGSEPEETDTETDTEEQTFVEHFTTRRPSPVRPLQIRPNRPNRRPVKRPGASPNKGGGIPVRIHYTKKASKRKGSKRPLNIRINNRRRPSRNRGQQRPVKVTKAVTLCPYECQCGVTTSRRIVGGTNAEKNEFPWMALLSYKGQLSCGGAVLNSEYVITAAHCMEQQKKNLFTIKLMQYDIRNDNPRKLVTRKISKVFIHPNYNSQTSDKDIALIKLNNPINFSKSLVRPICLPSLGKEFVGCKGVIAGWGTTRENGKESTVLKKAKVPIIANNQCKNLGLKGITSNMLCAGRVLKGGVDTCQGDSGGPLMVNENKRYVLAGIVSFGEGCARPNRPGVYTRTTKFLDWIKNTANSGCYCK